MRDINVANAELVGLWFQLLATGAYLVYFPRCMAFVATRRMQERGSIWLPVACTVIFFSTIADQVLALVRAYQAFGSRGDDLPNPVLYYQNNTATPLCMAKNSFNIILTLLSDVIIVYRTYVIWGFNLFVVAIPIGLIIANLAMGILTMMALLRAGAGDPDLTMSPPAMRLRYYFAMTFCLNMICAGLICWKIWRVNARVSRSLTPREYSFSGGSATNHVLEVIIQSAGIYCAHLFSLIVTDAVGTKTFFIFLDPLPPVAAITFSMLIVRARSHHSMPSMSSLGVSQRSGLRFWENRNSATLRPPPIGVEINLEHVVHTDMGSISGADTDGRVKDMDDGASQTRSPISKESLAQETA